MAGRRSAAGLFCRISLDIAYARRETVGFGRLRVRPGSTEGVDGLSGRRVALGLS